MNELALFAGAGGGLLASKLIGWQTIAAVELDPCCRDVLLARQRDGALDPFPIWDDVRTFDGRPWHGRVDVVSGGFPCQPFSGAGQRLGADDDRNMWPETCRIIRDVRPRYAFLENVPGLLASGYFGTVLGDLAALGYRVAWDCLPASALGAHHQRDRLWILAACGGVSDPGGGQLRKLRERDGKQCGQPGTPEPGDNGTSNPLADADRQVGGSGLMGPHPRPDGRDDASRSGSGGGRPMANPMRERRDRRPLVRSDEKGRKPPGIESAQGNNTWPPEPGVGRMAYGVARRVERLRALGNGQVPVVAAVAYLLLCEALEELAGSVDAAAAGAVECEDGPGCVVRGPL